MGEPLPAPRVSTSGRGIRWFHLPRPGHYTSMALPARSTTGSPPEDEVIRHRPGERLGRGAGSSTLTAGVCRWYAGSRGTRVHEGSCCMEPIDVHDLPEPVARAIRAMVEE